MDEPEEEVRKVGEEKLYEVRGYWTDLRTGRKRPFRDTIRARTKKEAIATIKDRAYGYGMYLTGVTAEAIDPWWR